MRHSTLITSFVCAYVAITLVPGFTDATAHGQCGAPSDSVVTGLSLPLNDTDNGGVPQPHTINVPAGPVVCGVNIGLQLTHTWVGDLSATIEHNGTTVQLLLYPGDPDDLPGGDFGCGEHDYDIMLDDEGTGGAIEDLCTTVMTSPPSYTPNSPLSAFDGMPSGGDWTITVEDVEPLEADEGVFTGWSLHIFGPCVAGGDPTTLIATAASSSAIGLAWTDNVCDETLFEIERSTTGVGGPFSLLDTVASDVTSYSDTTVLPGTEFCYRVRATGPFGSTAYTNVDCATTTVAPTSVVFEGVETANTAAFTSLTIVKPAGTVEGNLLIAVIGNEKTNATNAPALWMTVDDGLDGGNKRRVSTFFLVAGASEPADYTFTSTGARKAVGAILRYSGNDPTAPIDVSGVATGISGTPTSPDVITTVDGAMVVRIFGSEKAEDPSDPFPAGLDDRFVINEQGKITAGAADIGQALAGSTGTASFLLVDATKGWRAVTLAIAPAAGCPDADGDGVCDAADICPGFDDNVDTDLDGVPDGCDPCPLDNPDDTDGDGVCDSADICPGFDDTLDGDGDGVPDGCDICPGFDDTLDGDGDGVPDGCDPCPLDNPDDTDGDGVCDSADICPGSDDNIDADLDGVPDGCDICPGFDDTLDGDGDGVPDGCDICPGFDDNVDTDLDGVPDGCDPCPLDNPDDTDGDGICDSNDACPGTNPGDPIGNTGCSCSQLGAGRAIVDADSDGVPDLCDNCPDDPNFDQTDSDGDAVGDACDICPGFNDNLDADGDGVPDGCDPCPLDNPDDTDGDGVCDSADICPGFDDNIDADGDGVPDGCDICPGFDDTLDGDGDGVPDGCDPCPLDSPDDTDGDGVCDSADICPGFDDTLDGDGDSVPDGCDVCPGFDDTLDGDGDGVPDGCDPCPLDNPDDTDGDGVCDSVDICPGFDDNVDTDLDGVPDGCDPCPLGAGGGDSNGDTFTNGLDIEPFVDVLINGGPGDPAFCESDISGDGAVTLDDIPLFVRLLLDTGSCCLEDGTCQDNVTQSECVSAGGVYQGDDTTCGLVTCPAGACCAANGTCQNLTAIACAATGGTYQGDGTDCGSFTCPVLPDNDDCQNAEAISGAGTFAFDNTNATDTVLACDMDKDVWFCWTAPADGGFRIETCGQTSVNTKLAVYSECAPCPTLSTSLLVCNDDDCSLQSGVSIEAVLGQSYLVRLGSSPGEAGGSGNLVFSSLGFSPGAVDDCSDASTLASISGEGTFLFDNTQATSVGPDHDACDFFAQPGIDHDVWFCWTASCDGDVTIETCGQTSIDTKIAVYDNCATCPPTDADLLACDDDGGLGCDLQSRVTITAVNANSYLIRLGTFPGSSGGVGTFSITCSGP